jgi:hypothetical protein
MLYNVWAYAVFFGGSKVLNIFKALLTIIAFTLLYNLISGSVYNLSMH